MEKYDILEASEQLGVSTSSIDNYIRDGKLKADDENRFDVDHIQEAKRLRDEHGPHRWYKKSSWYVEPEEESETEAEAAESPSLAQRLIAKAKEYKAAGEFDKACDLFELVVDGFDFSS